MTYKKSGRGMTLPPFSEQISKSLAVGWKTNSALTGRWNTKKRTRQEFFALEGEGNVNCCGVRHRIGFKNGKLILHNHTSKEDLLSLETMRMLNKDFRCRCEEVRIFFRIAITGRKTGPDREYLAKARQGSRKDAWGYHYETEAELTQPFALRQLPKNLQPIAEAGQRYAQAKDYYQRHVVNQIASEESERPSWKTWKIRRYLGISEQLENPRFRKDFAQNRFDEEFEKHLSLVGSLPEDSQREDFLRRLPDPLKLAWWTRVKGKHFAKVGRERNCFIVDAPGGIPLTPGGSVAVRYIGTGEETLRPMVNSWSHKDSLDFTSWKWLRVNLDGKLEEIQ